MKKVLEIKSHVMGEGKPLVCVPVMETSKEKIIQEVQLLVEKGVEMIEWRVDAFESPTDMNAIREVLESIQPLVEHTIFVYTFRSKAQGGLLQLSEEQIYDIHQVAAEMKVVDFVDVEYFASKNPKKEIATLQRMGVHVIASHHDFDGTPKQDIMLMILSQMQESGADVVKLAVMPQTTTDVFALMAASCQFHEEYPKMPMITMSMGGKGCVSRICGETFGSCVTFGAGEKASAPGQLPMDELQHMVKVIHEAQDK